MLWNDGHGGGEIRTFRPVSLGGNGCLDESGYGRLDEWESGSCDHEGFVWGAIFFAMPSVL
jgi:hypothetical protein